MMEGFGKYVRHAIAVIIALMASALASLAFQYLGVQLATPEQIQGFADAISFALAPAVLTLVYAWTEKFLKRFPQIDLEGFADRIKLKQIAPNSAEEANIRRVPPV